MRLYDDYRIEKIEITKKKMNRVLSVFKKKTRVINECEGGKSTLINGCIIQR